MRDPKIYFVYIMTNRSKTLYTGVTNSLMRRVREHKKGIGSRFTSRYKLDRLAYYEGSKMFIGRLGGRRKSKAGRG
jgi:putative endonuclease